MKGIAELKNNINKRCYVVLQDGDERWTIYLGTIRSFTLTVSKDETDVVYNVAYIPNCNIVQVKASYVYFNIDSAISSLQNSIKWTEELN